MQNTVYTLVIAVLTFNPLNSVSFLKKPPTPPEISSQVQAIPSKQPIALPEHKEEPTLTPIVATPVVVAGCGDNSYANYIYMHESGCRLTAVNPIGACGIGQSLPCSKLSSSCPDWQTNYACQNAWFTDYVNRSYGGWLGAYNHWLQFSWY